jgi:hypothetical protein
MINYVTDDKRFWCWQRALGLAVALVAGMMLVAQLVWDAVK